MTRRRMMQTVTNGGAQTHGSKLAELQRKRILIGRVDPRTGQAHARDNGQIFCLSESNQRRYSLDDPRQGDFVKWKVRDQHGQPGGQWLLMSSDRTVGLPSISPRLRHTAPRLSTVSP